MFLHKATLGRRTGVWNEASFMRVFLKPGEGFGELGTQGVIVTGARGQGRPAFQLAAHLVKDWLTCPGAKTRFAKCPETAQ